MRRANQQDPTTNGQYRIVSDHLGSTSIVVDTYTGGAGPRVGQRQYHKPYGEVAYQSMGTSGSLTSIGYTGQRLEADSGLMFYNARFYDPALSYFVSADNIAPDKGDPKTRNRYSYVLYNPLKYNDPTGHCVGDTTRGDAEACESAANHLRKFGFRLDTQYWTAQELWWIIEAINDLLAYAGYQHFDYDGFKSMMNSHGTILDLINTERTPLDAIPDYMKNPATGRVADACTQFCGSERGLGVNAARFKQFLRSTAGGRTNIDNEPDVWAKAFKYVIVHELAHVMDARNGMLYSRQLAMRRWWFASGPGGVPIPQHEEAVSPYGDNDDAENWAEAVASAVYPGFRPSNIHGRSPRRYTPRTNQYLNEVFGGFRGQCYSNQC